MKVAYIAGSRIPSREANSIHVMKMCQAFRQEGYDPLLIVPKHDNQPIAVTELWDHFGISEPFPIQWVGTDRFPGKRQRYAWRTVRQAKLHGAQVIYTRQLLSAVWAARAGVPTIYEAHTPIEGGASSRLYFQLLLRSRSFWQLVVITAALRDEYLRCYPTLVSKKRLVVAPDAVDLERFEHLPTPENARALLGLSSQQFTVGYAGHLYSGRGIEVILALAERFPQATFLIMGGKDEHIQHFRNQLNAKLVNNVHFLGFLANAVLPDYLAACDVLLMPYQRKIAVSGGGNTAQWTSPMKMFEYMATGRLIISSDLPVLREVLNEQNAVLCPPDDVTAWQYMLERAQADPNWRLAIGYQAQQDVKQYSWRQRVHRVLAQLP